jgi:predicted porin
MNKNLLALAVAGALAAPGIALAQASNVQIYGLFDMSALQNRYSGNSAGTIGSVTKYDVFNAASRMGVRGTEDLGNGLKAWFQAELTMFPDGRVPEATNPAGFFGGRNSGVGLEGSWGNALIGAWDSPYKQTQYTTWVRGAAGPLLHAGMIMNNADTTGAAPNAQCSATISPATGLQTGGAPLGASAGTTNATGASCPNQVEGSATSFHRRLSNTIQYWSPTWAGFQLKVGTQVNEGKTPGTTINNPNTSLWSYGLTWAGGPWNAGLGYEQHKGYNGTTASADPNVKDTGIMLGGGWNFGIGQVAIGWERLKYGNNAAAGAAETNLQRNNWTINGTFKVGANGSIFAGYSKTPGGRSCGAGSDVNPALCGSSSGASFTSLGYEHALSKRSALYAIYGRINNNAGASFYYIAAPNGPNGFSSAIAAGTDVTTLGVGMKHTF